MAKHGIFIQEDPTAITAPREATAGLQVVIGTAPVNMAEDPAAVVNVPVLATNATEAMAALGYIPDYKNYTLCQSMYIQAGSVEAQEDSGGADGGSDRPAGRRGKDGNPERWPDC